MAMAGRSELFPALAFGDVYKEEREAFAQQWESGTQRADKIGFN